MGTCGSQNSNRRHCWEKNDNWKKGLVAGLVAGLIAGLITGVVGGLVTGSAITVPYVKDKCISKDDLQPITEVQTEFLQRLSHVEMQCNFSSANRQPNEDDEIQLVGRLLQIESNLSTIQEQFHFNLSSLISQLRDLELVENVYMNVSTSLFELVTNFSHVESIASAVMEEVYILSENFNLLHSNVSDLGSLFSTIEGNISRLSTTLEVHRGYVIDVQSNFQSRLNQSEAKILTNAENIQIVW